MAVFVLAIVAASQIFTGLLTQFKQQSKIAETNIEGIVGLEILRRDIEHTGYGLPWNYPAALANYNEAAPTNVCNGGAWVGTDPANYNDLSANAPKATLTGNNICYNGSDYLVIKAANVAQNIIAQKWTHLRASNLRTTWTPDCENVNKNSDCTTNNTVRVVVISPGSTDTNTRLLIVSGGAFFTQYNNTANFAPTDSTETMIIYGIDGDTNLRVPFNRADYYISASNVPQRCATNTGVLYKATFNHGAAVGGNEFTELPLLDCAADMQVVFGLDTNNNGIIGTYSNADGTSVASWPVGAPDENVASATSIFADPALLRQTVKEVRIYILAHEGQRDVNYTYCPSSAASCSTAFPIGDFGLGSTFDLTTITDWQNYRWKVYTLVVKPNNLR